MPRYTQACTSCAWADDISARPFENPTCPSCGRDTERSWTGKPTAIERDEIPGGQWFENGFDEPVRFDSHSEHEKALAARGLEIGAKWAGPRDKIMSNWAAGIDAQTLANAAALVSRGSRAPEPEDERIPITVTNMDETFTYQVKR